MDIDDIRARYAELVRTYILPGNIFKADADNETRDELPWPCPGDVYCVELDPFVAVKASDMGWNVKIGDIRRIPYEPIFSTVVDLSTIDHVPPEDVPKVIAEYDRILEPGGRLILVAWCADVAEKIGWPGEQYVLNEDALFELLCSHGFLLRLWGTITTSDKIRLMEIVADKGEGC